MTVSARFWSKASVAPADACWTWHAAKVTQGYGRFNLNGVNSPAHRVAWELTNGPIPDGMEIDHLCRNRICVNPAHLEAVPHGENVRRGESFAARRARQTHCVHGHEFTPDNTRMRGSLRNCRVCDRARNKARIRARRKAAEA